MIQVEVDADDALRRLLNIADGLKDARPLYATLGEVLRDAHRQRFDAQVSPEGQAWAPLNAKYAARKRFGQILYREGVLKNTLRYNVTGNGVRFGTDRKYGIYHQYGTSKMPARPWLGVSKKDEKVLLEKTTDYVRRLIG